jgi:hypothetical protein
MEQKESSWQTMMHVLNLNLGHCDDYIKFKGENLYGFGCDDLIYYYVNRHRKYLGEGK